MRGRSGKKLAFMAIAIALFIAFSPMALGGTSPSIEWSQNFGGSSEDLGMSVQETSDSGYIVTGHTYSSANGYQAILIKTNACGKELWNNTFGGAYNYCFGVSVQETSDGGYIIAGSAYLGSNSQVYLVKTDASGRELWNSTFGGDESQEYGSSVQETSDGGYIIAGSTSLGYDSNLGYERSQVYLIKTDANGRELWNNTFKGAYSNYGQSAQETSDGGYIVAGYGLELYTVIGYGSVWQYPVYLLKTDANGKELWNNTFGVVDWIYDSSVQETPDGGYIVTGTVVAGTTTYGDNNHQVYLVKTDASGRELWSNTFGGGESQEYGNSVQETSDGGYIVAGSTASGYSSHVYLVKTDASGKELWNYAFGEGFTDHGYSVQETSDGGYIVAGSLEELDKYSQVYLIKLHYIKTEWAKTPGGSCDDGGSSVQQTSDGGYIVAGHTTSFGHSEQAYLLKTDTNGDKIWEKAYGGEGDEEGYSVNLTSDGGYIIAGTTTSFGNGSQVYLVKTNNVGDKIWEKAYGGEGDEEGYSVQQTSDGGYVAAGTTTSFGNGSQVYLVKTDSGGNKTWAKDFGGPGDEGGYSVQQISDGYIVVGYTTSFDKRYQVYLLKTDTDGNKIWHKDFGEQGDEWGYSVQQIYDGYIVAGYTTSSDKHYQAYLLKTDIDGNEIWHKELGGLGEERAYSVQQTPADEGYILAGYATPYINGSQVYIVKTDADGNELWYYRFGGAGDEGGMSVINTADGNYAVAGATSSFGDGDQVYLAKLVDLGVEEQLQSPQKQIASNNSAKISPGSRPNHLQRKRPIPPAKPVKQPRSPRVRPQRTSISQNR